MPPKRSTTARIAFWTCSALVMSVFIATTFGVELKGVSWS
jgi:hypothetical protein